MVTAGDNLRVRSFPGTVEASRRVELAFRVPGLLVKLPVKEGQKVTKGDLIAQLRQGEFEARLASLQGELDQARAALQALRGGQRPEEIRRREAELRAAEARLANARAEFGRIASLLPKEAVTLATYERSETAYRIAQEEHTSAVKLLSQATSGREEDVEAMEAQVRGLEGRLVETRIQLEDSTLLAPYDGVIALRFADEGQNIRANDRVVQFQDVDEIDIAIDVPETVMASEVKRSEIVQMTAELGALPGVEFPVRICEISQVADPVTQTFRVRVAMEAATDLRVLPGMTASVTLGYRRAAILGDGIRVPVQAVARTPDGEQVVWVLDERDFVSPTAVKLGGATGGQLEVVSGLRSGDRIVVAGVRFLRKGQQVRDLGNSLSGGAL